MRRYKKQTGGRGQFGDCDIVLEPIDGHEGYEFVDKIVGGVIPQSFRPAVDKGIQEAMHTASSPAHPSRACASRSSTARTTTSTPRRWRSRSPARWRSRRRTRRPTPCCSSRSWSRGHRARRGGRRRQRRPQLAPRTPDGMEPAAGMTTIKAEVPMAEMLTYAQSLTSMTGGRGDYSMQLRSATRRCRRTSRRSSSPTGNGSGEAAKA